MKIQGIKPTKELFHKLSVGDEYIYIFTDKTITRYKIIKIYDRGDNFIYCKLKCIWTNKRNCSIGFMTEFKIYDNIISLNHIRINLSLQNRVNKLLKL